MGQRARVASTYQVKYDGAEYGTDEFRDYYEKLYDLADFLGYMGAVSSNYDYTCGEEEWFEFEKRALTGIQEYLKKEHPEETELLEVVDGLLETGDPDLDFVRVEIW